MKMILLADIINDQGSRGLVVKLDKIDHNLILLQPLKDAISKKRQTAHTDFSLMTVYGRWIVVFQSNGVDDSETMMHLIDFRIELSDPENLEIFSNSTLTAMIELQTQYDSIFSPAHDNVELSFAEPFERVLKPNLFVCNDDKIVIQKARELGVLPLIEKFQGDDKVKVSIVDEEVSSEGSNKRHLYAIIHLGGHADESENGYIYLKVYDVLRNQSRLEGFIEAIEKAGGKFDRSFFTERFNYAKLN